MTFWAFLKENAVELVSFFQSNLNMSANVTIVNALKSDPCHSLTQSNQTPRSFFRDRA